MKRITFKNIQATQAQGTSPVQEDYFEINPERGIFIIADGFGGSAGKEAAELVVKAVRYYLEQEAGDFDATMPFELRSYYSLAGNVLFNAITYANQKLNEVNQSKNWLERGGASLLAGYLEGRLLALAQVGACSLHLSRNGKVKEIISPKTLARQLNPFDDEVVATDQIIPLMSFGTVRQLEPEMHEFEVKEGDQFLFQTSGVAHDQITSILKNGFNKKLSQFVDETAKESNSSVILLSF